MGKTESFFFMLVCGSGGVKRSMVSAVIFGFRAWAVMLMMLTVTVMLMMLVMVMMHEIPFDQTNSNSNSNFSSPSIS